MTEQELRERILAGQSSSFIIKRSLPRNPIKIVQILKNISRIHDGLIVFGVDLSEGIVGVDDSDKLVKTIELVNKYLPMKSTASTELININSKIVAVVSLKNAEKKHNIKIRDKLKGNIINISSTKKMIKKAYESGVSYKKSKDELSEAILLSRDSIKELRKDFDKENSIPRKVSIGVGVTIIGVVLKLVIDSLT